VDPFLWSTVPLPDNLRRSSPLTSRTRSRLGAEHRYKVPLTVHTWGNCGKGTRKKQQELNYGEGKKAISPSRVDT
jgi:hypothetical protein